MSEIKHFKTESVNLKEHPEINEFWVHDRIQEDPGLLEIGEDLQVVDHERRQRRGRLDLLLEDKETETMYEVEVQLGGVDPSHIIRCIDYWVREKKRTPGREHVAVLIAEDFSDYFDVIQLLGKMVDVILLKLLAIKVNEDVSLKFIKMLDSPASREEEDEDSRLMPDRASWETRGGKESLNLIDQLHSFARAVVPESNLRYLNSKVALKTGARANWFVDFQPRKHFVEVWLHSQVVGQWENKLREAGIDKARKFRDGIAFRLTPESFEKNKPLFEELFKEVHELSKKS